MKSLIPDEESLFRGAHHPVAFSSKAFNPAKFMKLYSGELDFREIEASFIWERYAPTALYVHAFGCRRSAERNNGKRNKSDVYCGAYQIRPSSIRALAGITKLPEIVSADVVHEVEQGEIAHASLKVQLSAAVADEEDAEELKTAIADHLWKQSRGPLRHVCATDKRLVKHPNGLLEVAPLGNYQDSRAAFVRARWVLRFWSLLILWKAGILKLP